MPKKKNPPSKKGQGKKKDKKGKGIPNQKDEGKKQKVKIDKTFGMKNKKGRSNAQYVANMRANMKANERKEKKSKKQLFKEQQKLQAQFWGDGGPGIIKAPANCIPKDTLCPHFRVGRCNRGLKCKFSHDFDIASKVAKRKRQEREAKDKKTMRNMTQQELEDTIKSKLRKEDNQTDIVCNYFLDALEKRLYGYRWKCKNGPKCIYRHALPPGWRLKDPTITEEPIVRESLEETLENMRKEFVNRTDLTPVTAESFAAWKEKRKKEDEETALRKIEEAKEATVKKKKMTKAERQLSGRKLFEMFSFDDGDVSGQGVEKKVTPLPKVEEKIMEFDESLFVDDEVEVEEKTKPSQQQSEPKKDQSQQDNKKANANDDGLEFDESLFMDDF